MRKITLHVFLVFSILFSGLSVFAEGVEIEKNFEKLIQLDSAKDAFKNPVLIELANIVHNSQVTKEEVFMAETAKTTILDAACQSPSFTITKDCDVESLTIMLNIEILSLGSASAVVISDNVNSPSQTVTTPGVVNFGPYPYGVDITITVADADDPSCSSSETTNSDTCPPIPCELAEPFCSDEGLLFENSSENGPGQTPPDMPDLDYGCLFTQPNPVWYFLQIGEAGDMTLHIEQNTSFDENGNANGTGLDVDFIAWGPFDSLDEACNNLTPANQVPNNYMGNGCSYSAAPTENFGIVDGQVGDIYVLLLTNYSGQPGYIKVTQTAGDGATDCSIVHRNEVLGCYGEEILLEAQEPAPDGQNVWYVYNPATDEYELTDDTEFSSSYVVTESGKYKVESFTDEGEIIEEYFTVVVSPEPELNNLEEEVSVCGVDQVTLDGTVFNPEAYGGIQYRWYDEDGELVGSSATLNVSNTGVYTLEITTVILNSEGYESGEECVMEVEVAVTDADFEVSLGEDQILCAVESVILVPEVAGENPEDGIYTWTNEDGEVIGNEMTLEVTETGTYTVEVSIGGCSNVASVYIELNGAPQFNLGGDITTCTLEDFQIEADLMGADITDSMVFEWTYNGEPIEEDGPIVNPADYGYGVYTLTIYDGSPDCSSTEDVTINEVDDFDVELSADNDLTKTLLHCPGEEGDLGSYEINFTATVHGLSEDEVVFVWYKNGEVIEGANGNSYYLVYDSEGDYNDEITVEIEVGSCSANASLTTHVDYGEYEHPCKISEGLSPGNNDGYNDYLDLTFIHDRSGIAKFTVYNRYGTKVFDRKDYTNEWHGQDNKGKELASGTYYYVLEMKNEDPVFGKTKKGWIYVNQSVN